MDAPRRPKPMPSQEAADVTAEEYASQDEGGTKDERYAGEFGKRVAFVGGSGKKRSGGGGGGGGISPPRCQAEKCAADLIGAKRYHRRHKVCELHARASSVLVAGLQQRFCQQCSRFHDLSEFDDTKKSCRRRLAGHNERRRKSSSESHEEGSGCQRLDLPVNENRGRPLIDFPESSTHKQFRIR